MKLVFSTRLLAGPGKKLWCVCESGHHPEKNLKRLRTRSRVRNVRYTERASILPGGANHAGAGVSSCTTACQCDKKGLCSCAVGARPTEANQSKVSLAEQTGEVRQVSGCRGQDEYQALPDPTGAA